MTPHATQRPAHPADLAQLFALRVRPTAAPQLPLTPEQERAILRSAARIKEELPA